MAGQVRSAGRAAGELSTLSDWLGKRERERERSNQLGCTAVLHCWHLNATRAWADGVKGSCAWVWGSHGPGVCIQTLGGACASLPHCCAGRSRRNSCAPCSGDGTLLHLQQGSNRCPAVAWMPVRGLGLLPAAGPGQLTSADGSLSPLNCCILQRQQRRQTQPGNS